LINGGNALFGYVKPQVGELKVSEYEYYRAVYCGVCRMMGRECGNLSRLCLSYDLTFLALFLCAVRGENSRVVKARCPVNPLVKKNMVLDSESVTYAAAACGALAAYGFRDDKSDENGLRRIGAGIGAAVSESWLARARKKYPGLCEGIEEKLGQVYDAENEARKQKAADVSLDELAGKFGDVLAFVFAYPVSSKDFGDDEKTAEYSRAICTNVGHHVGRWIYCIDAIDDIKEDEKKQRFNPFLLTYGKSGFTDDEKLTLASILRAEADEAADALDLCEFFTDAAKEPMNIIENILHLGMPDTARRVIDGTYRKPGREKI